MTLQTARFGVNVDLRRCAACISAHPFICRSVTFDSARILRQPVVTAGVVATWHMPDMCMRFSKGFHPAGHFA
jgi:hypothetical protein